MAKQSNREKILTEGLRVVHERGFAGAGVRDIVRAAGVPQGSFTNHFASKEAFGLEIIDLYFARGRDVMRATLLDDSQPPLQRLAAYIDSQKDRQSQNGMRNGCLFGNFAAEASDNSEGIRLPEIREGTVGHHARSLGGASLPLSDRFLTGPAIFPKTT